jgi:hypothetical protein
MDGTLADAGTRFLPPGSLVVRAALARRQCSGLLLAGAV